MDPNDPIFWRQRQQPEAEAEQRAPVKKAPALVENLAPVGPANPHGHILARINEEKRQEHERKAHDRSMLHAFMIPFFDEDDDAEEEWYGPRVLTYRKDEIPDTPQAQEAMQGVLSAERLLREAEQRGDAPEHQDALRSALTRSFTELSQIMGDWRPSPSTPEG